jgi:hypothetical protein
MRPFALLPLLLLAIHTQAQLPDPFFPQLPQGTRVEALAASGDTLFVAGDFSMLGPYYRQHIGAVDIPSGAILPWGPSVNGTVRGLLHRDGLLFLWGAFTQVNGQPRNNLAVLQAHTGELQPFNPAITFPGIPGLQTGTISSLDLAGDTLFLGGYFLSVNGQSRSNLAALTLDGTLLPWAPSTNIPVEQVLVIDQTVYVGGPFTQPRPGLAAFHSSSGALLPWAPEPNNPGNTIGPLALMEGGAELFVSGRFSHLDGNAHPFLARVDGQSGQPSDFNPGILFTSPGQVTVRTFSQYAGDLYVGGQFATAFHGLQRTNLAVLDAGTGMMREWNPAPNGGVNAILHHQGAVFVGGAFSQISGQPHRLLAAYNTFTTSTEPPLDQQSGGVRIFPNPVSDRAFLETAANLQQARLIAPDGRVSREWGILPEGLSVLDLQGLPAGTYRLVWRSAAGGGSIPLQLIR